MKSRNASRDYFEHACVAYAYMCTIVQLSGPLALADDLRSCRFRAPEAARNVGLLGAFLAAGACSDTHCTCYEADGRGFVTADGVFKCCQASWRTCSTGLQALRVSSYLLGRSHWSSTSCVTVGAATHAGQSRLEPHLLTIRCLPSLMYHISVRSYVEHHLRYVHCLHGNILGTERTCGPNCARLQRTDPELPFPVGSGQG